MTGMPAERMRWMLSEMIATALDLDGVGLRIPS